MDNFKAVYWILSKLEEDLDKPKADVSRFDHAALGVSEARWNHYIEMMADCGYIKGVTIKENVFGEIISECENIKITLKGLEYLQENSLMRKAYNMIKGIEDIIPGL